MIAALFGAVFSMLINRLVYFQFLRRGTRLFGMIIVTIAMSLIIQNVLFAIFRPTFFSYQASQGSSHRFGSMTFTASQLAIMGIAVVAMLGVHLLMTRTRLGKAMRATATNPSLARSCGVATDRVIDLATSRRRWRRGIYEEWQVPDVINVFQNAPIHADRTFGNEIPTSKPGDRLVMRALIDGIVVAISACPQDLNPPRPVSQTSNGVRCRPSCSTCGRRRRCRLFEGGPPFKASGPAEPDPDAPPDPRSLRSNGARARALRRARS